MPIQSHSRYITKSLQTLALKRGKMAFLSGPRQVGKTTLAKELLKQNGAGAYYNWDDIEFRRVWTKSPKKTIQAFSTEPLFIYDEIHKAAKWKNTLKGIFDTLESPAQILVTGSARLNIYKKGGDSLLGRYLHFRLHPFSCGELVGNLILDPAEAIQHVFNPNRLAAEGAKTELENLLRFGGFPEPLFEASDELARIWRRGRLEKIVREDLRDLSRLPELSQIEMLVSLLQEKAGGMLSVQSLREDLDVAHTTVKRWLNYLNQLYYCYQIRPFTRSIPRSLKKDGKLYLWDWSEVENNAGARFENMVAGHLLKACHFWTDIGKGDFELQYLRDKDQHEIDFLVTWNKKPWLAVEAKLQDAAWSPSFQAFRKRISIPFCVQVIQGARDKTIWRDGLTDCALIGADDFLSCLP